MRHASKMYYVAAILGSMSSTVAAAQSDQTDSEVDEAAESSEGGREILVTGSRILRRDYVSESPIVTLDQEDIALTGSPSIDTKLNQLPQLTASASTAAPTANTRGGQASANLRGLGQQRTLVLLDGRRLQPAGIDGSVDLNVVPASLISNIEIITGGASAVYGSDAVTGVVNLKLRKDVQGFELTGRALVSDEGDGATYNVSGLYGTGFADGRGYAVFAADYSSRDGILMTARDSVVNQSASGTLPEGNLIADGSNLPTQAAVNSVFSTYGYAPGTVSRTTSFGFNTDGTLFNARGPINFRSGDLTNTGLESSTRVYYAGDWAYIQTPMTRYNTFGHVEYETNGGVKAFAELLYTDNSVKAQFPPAVLGSNSSTIPVIIPITNPFIPDDLAAVLASRPDPDADFNVRKRLIEAGPHVETYDYKVYQAVLGLSGDLGEDWKWSASGSYGRTKLDQTSTAYQSSSAINNLLAQPDGGASLCDGGLNLFGLQANSQSCLDYIDHTVVTQTVLSRHAADLGLTGTLLELPAGPLSVAFGVEYRRDEFNFEPDELSAIGDIAGYQPILPSSGSVNAKEFYIEALIPVLNNSVLAQEFNVGLAYRYSDYSSIGSTDTYKIDLDWLLRDGVRFRAGYSRAVRAPSVGELYAPIEFGRSSLGSIGSVGQGDPCDIRSAYRASADAAEVEALCLAQGIPAPILDAFTDTNVNTTFQTSGNANLQAEVADTYSAGVVLRPNFGSSLFSSLSFSIDYYKIKLGKAIGMITNILATQRCFNADGTNPTYDVNNYYCQLIERDTQAGLISSIQNPLFNLGGFETDGVDFALDWAIPLGKGDVRLSSNVNYLRSFKIRTVQNGPEFDYAGTILNTQIDPLATAHPEWKAISSIGYDHDQFDVQLTWRFIDKMENANNVGTDGDLPAVDAVSYFDLNAGIDVAENFRFSAGIINLFDKKPPMVNTSVIGQYLTDLYTYDIVGRRMFVQARMTF